MGVMHYFKVNFEINVIKNINFKAAQPALLYLVPTCIIIPLFVAMLRGEFKQIWNYSEEHLVEKSDKEKKLKAKEDKKEKKNK